MPYKYTIIILLCPLITGFPDFGYTIHIYHFGGKNMFEELKALLVEKFLIDEKEITPDAELAADLGINSIELAELLDSCAEKFNINIDDDSDIPTFVTVGDIVEFMEKNK